MSPSFTGKGLIGYAFGPLKKRDLAIDYVEVESGHDTFQVSRKITRFYYILSGSGYFTIGDRQYPVSSGVLVEVPPKVEYSYSGKMRLILFQQGRWLPDNDVQIKWNPDVVEGAFPCSADAGIFFSRLGRLRIFGKSPIKAYLRLNRVLWNNLPASFSTLAPIRSYGNFLHTLVRMQGVRGQAFATYFLRNRPQLELIRRLVARRTETDAVRIAVLGCSIGVEVYSVAWAIRSAKSNLKLILHGVDISRDAVEMGKRGVYSLVGSQWTNTDLFERMTEGEIEEFFDRVDDEAMVKSRIKDGIKWQVCDVGDPQILDTLEQQDIVVANNFLCHMEPPMAERCLRNIARLVKPKGYLFVSGIDLDVRTRVADDLGWLPVEELLGDIHEGDPSITSLWPLSYVGLEPLNKNRQDWRRRYAAAFQLMPHNETEQGLNQFGIVGENERDDTVARVVSAATARASVSTRSSDPRSGAIAQAASAG
jgi:SAM-dependent methyltransferase